MSQFFHSELPDSTPVSPLQNTRYTPALELISGMAFSDSGQVAACGISGAGV